MLIVMQDVDPWPLNPVDAPALLERHRNATARPAPFGAARLMCSGSPVPALNLLIFRSSAP